MQYELVPFRDFEQDEVYGCFTNILETIGAQEDADRADSAEWFCGCAAQIIRYAESAGIGGNVWAAWLAKLFAEAENPFSLAHERREVSGGTMERLAADDMEQIYFYLKYDLTKLEKSLNVNILTRAANFVPSPDGPASLERTAGAVIAGLAAAMEKAASPAELYKAVTDFYHSHGVGKFALYNGFRWDDKAREIVPAAPLEDITFDRLFGYEEQKRALIDNTVAFIEGRPANNVLLYGEGGTGKSSSIKALLNEYAPRGLRMIELYKHQMADFEAVLDAVKWRNYKFIIFMDDLSFEQFEVEYKFLKAFIEGGLEKRPDNVLIYATSNRRHLMKETWSDRDDKSDDMHESETMQEKMSLVDRFGLMIRYFSPEQEQYLDIARRLAAQYGIDTQSEEFEKGAIRWELKHGGFSGRSARQYVEHLAGLAGK